MTDDESGPPVDDVLADEDLYVYSEADLSQITGEAYQRLAAHDDLDAETAEQVCDMIHDLLTGGWTTDT